MGNLKIISATEARNNWFEILDWVNSERKEILIKKNKKVVAKILPGDRANIENPEEIIKRTFGYLKDKRGAFPYQEDKKVIVREKKQTTSTNYGKTDNNY